MRVPIPKAHWTPAYIVNRTKWALWQRRNPERPWIVPEAAAALEHLLRPSDLAVEFGAGRSTRWLARLVGQVVSIEHNPEWHTNVTSQLQKADLKNVSLCLAPSEEDKYVKAAADALPDEPTVVFVDGLYRAACTKWAIDRLKQGSLLILDNCEWYLPGSPPSGVPRAPNTRRPSDGEDMTAWPEVWQELSTWRYMWFSSGVTETAVFLAPPSRSETPASAQ